MNLALRQREEDEARGWSSVGEKWTCPDHVEDEALEALIVENATSTTCSYCDRKEEKPFAVDVDLIVERIGTSLPFEWGNADDEGVGWEGGYVHKTWDTWDLITEAIDSPLNNGDLISDVVGALPEQGWVQRDFYRLSDGDRLIFGWGTSAKSSSIGIATSSGTTETKKLGRSTTWTRSPRARCLRRSAMPW